MVDTSGINDPDMLLCDIMERWPQTLPVFIKHKMHCVGCVITPYHTVRDACREHHVSENAFRRELVKAAAEV